MQTTEEKPSATETKPVRNLLYSQSAFIATKAKFPLIIGTWGCGKSLAGLYAVDQDATNHDKNLQLVIRKEWVDMRDSTLHDWRDEIGVDINGEKEAHYPNGSVVMFRHGSDIDSLKNINLGGALMIQAEEMTEEEFWFLAGRLRRKNGSLQLRLEANYAGHNWLWRIWKKRQFSIPPEFQDIIKPEDFLLIETDTLENKENLPPAYIASMASMPERLRKRHFLGSWDDVEGLVYDEFNEKLHVVKPFEVPDSWERGFVLDHGFTNPTAVLWYAIDYDGTIFLYDEHYEGEKTPSYHAEKIKERGLTSGICDPAIFAKTQTRNGSLFSIASEYEDYGIHLSPALRSEESAQLARVNEFFKAGKIKIFSNLTNTINEVSNWKWKKPSANRLDFNLPESPEDKNNHLCDDLKYLIATRFAAPKKKDKPAPRHSVQTLLREMEHMAEQNDPESFFEDA